MQDQHHHADHGHQHVEQQYAYSPAPQQHYAYPPVPAPYGGPHGVNEVHVYHHAVPSQVRLRLGPSCCGRGGFPEHVPYELGGRVADGDYVAQIRQLNSDLSRAGRWGWGALPCLVAVVVGIIGGSITFTNTLSHDSSLINLLPWGLVAGLSFIGVAFFYIFSTLKVRALPLQPARVPALTGSHS